MDNLVEELGKVQRSEYEYASLCIRAANRIEADAAEIARLQARVKELEGERDAIRAAAMAEAERECMKLAEAYGNVTGNGGCLAEENAAETCAKAILALAKAPPRTVCAPVEPTVEQTWAGYYADSQDEDELNHDRYTKIYRAMTAQRSE